MNDINGDGWTVMSGSCLDRLGEIPDSSIEAIVTDPPYGLSNTDPEHIAEALARWGAGERDFIPDGRGFMGKAWDAFVPPPAVWDECLRVLKPGGHLLAFAGSRTFDLMTLSVRLAGFEIRDSIAWLYGSGFPKSHNIEKATRDKTWSGWGTALKPAFEPVVVARKPLIGTVAANVLTYGTGGLNIDGSRIGSETVTINTFDNGAKPFGDAVGEPFTSRQSTGRWPANVILDEYTAELLDEQSGERVSGGGAKGVMGGMFGNGNENPNRANSLYFDNGGASRFFYVAKASKRDRNEGLDERANFHPTVKPTDLMRQLVKLVTPPGGTVLDPFTGSGSTGKAAILEGFNFIGVELTDEYLPIIEGRLKHAEEIANIIDDEIELW